VKANREISSICYSKNNEIRENSRCYNGDGDRIIDMNEKNEKSLQWFVTSATILYAEHDYLVYGQTYLKIYNIYVYRSKPCVALGWFAG